jgi:UrcA family protein
VQTKTFLTALTAIAALGFASAGQSAFAQSDDGASIKVQYADLNLSSDAGAKVMLQRIRHAAKSVCGPEPTSSIDRVATAHARCVKTAVSRTVSQLDSPMVTALYSGALGAAPTTLASAR